METAVPLATCARCGQRCRIGVACSRTDYALVVLTPATAARGLCAECAAHWWLFSVDGLRWSFADGPGVLRMPAVRVALGRLLGAMHPKLGALDWDRLIAQWDLSWPHDWQLPRDG